MLTDTHHHTVDHVENRVNWRRSPSGFSVSQHTEVCACAARRIVLVERNARGIETATAGAWFTYYWKT